MLAKSILEAATLVVVFAVHVRFIARLWAGNDMQPRPPIQATPDDDDVTTTAIPVVNHRGGSLVCPNRTYRIAINYVWEMR